MRRLAAGETVDPAQYYFRTAASFEAAPGPHAWLSRHVVVGVGARHPEEVRIRFFVLG
jgi:Protein of unknown function (DUF3237)